MTDPVAPRPTLSDLTVNPNGHSQAELRDNLEELRLTDRGNARRFWRDHHRDLRWLAGSNHWIVYDGRRWGKAERGEAVQRAEQTAAGLLAEAAYTDDAAQRRALTKHALQSESEPAIRRMLFLAQSEPGMTVVPSELDRDSWLLCCPNGTVELRSGRRREHRREDFITKMTAAPYDPDARHPVFEAYLNRVLPDPEVRRFVQRYVGQALTGDVSEEKIGFAHGPTASGKSTFLRALRMTLGDYAAVADFSTFLERGYDGPRDDIARLAGVRLVVSVEVKDGSRLAEGLIKWISGGDVITARRLYERTFEFQPQFKLLLAANHRPRARDDDDALWRRIVEIPFKESIPESERDPSVKTTLCEPAQAGAAILAWAIEGCLAWQREGLAIPSTVRAATADYRRAMNPLQDFLTEACVLEAGAAMTARELRVAYEGWARENGVRNPLSGRAFADRLKGQGCLPSRRHGGERWWTGVRLRGALDGDAVTDGDASSETPPYARAREESSRGDVTKRHPSPDVSPEPAWLTAPPDPTVDEPGAVEP